MLYYTLRPFVSFLLKFFIKRISISGLANIPEKGAVLLASNHPNSFFDAILLCCTINRRVWSLARGDVFKKSWAKKMLSSLFMLPVYRLSEGKDNLGENDDTFKQCIELFKKGEIVLIFSEGLCINQSEILPLKKGTARLFQQATKEGVNVCVVPVGISYDNYKSFGKNITLNFGKSFDKSSFQEAKSDGFFLKQFNETLLTQLRTLATWRFSENSFLDSPLFYIGTIINFPANFLTTLISGRITKGTVFFDSITIGLMIVIYPLYWIFLATFVYFILKNT